MTEIKIKKISRFDLNKAIDLIHLSAENGADAAKFQHFKADTIVSDIGFRRLNKKKSHQASWKKSVYEVYKDASINLKWTEKLKKACDDSGIVFFTSPYDLDLVDYVNKYVPAFKIGSGDITYIEIIKKSFPTDRNLDAQMEKGLILLESLNLLKNGLSTEFEEVKLSLSMLTKIGLIDLVNEISAELIALNTLKKLVRNK